jgi:hypothetical protein
MLKVNTTLRLNLSPLNQEGRALSEALVRVFLRHTEPWFEGFIATGDTLRQAFLEGASEASYRVYLDRRVFSEDGHLPYELCRYLLPELEQLDCAPFRYLRCDLTSSFATGAEAAPIPKAYHLLAGCVPVPERTNRQLHAAAAKALATLDPAPEWVARNLVELDGSHLENQLKFQYRRVWSTLYHLLTLQQKDGIQVWGLPKAKAVELLAPDSEMGKSLRAYLAALKSCPVLRPAAGQALAVLDPGFAFLKAARRWWDRSGGRAKGSGGG